MIALAALWALAAVGVWRRRHDALVPVLLVALVAHVALFALYGDEGFLYAAPLLPLVTGLVVVAAVSEVRRPLIATCWALVPLLALVNVPAVHDIGGLIGPTYVGEPDWDLGGPALAGAPEKIAHVLKKFGAMGVGQVQVRLRSRSADELVEQIERFGAEVIPLLG